MRSKPNAVMGLVEYLDSATESEAEEEPLLVDAPPKKKPRLNGDASKRATLPSLPTAFRDLYASNIRVSVRDDPNLHGGRKRVIPHVEGNWPTHIYLEWYPRRDELSILSNVLSKCGRRLSHDGPQICSLLHSDLGVQLPLHISLSRPVVLATDQKQPFIEAFKHSIQSLNTKPFAVLPDTLAWVSNSERTRWFLVLRLEKPLGDELNRLLRASNQTLALFGQPPLYATEKNSSSEKKTKQRQEENLTDIECENFTERFHISLAWSLTEPPSEQQQRVARVDLDSLKSLEIPFKSVKAKIGNVVHNLDL